MMPESAHRCRVPRSISLPVVIHHNRENPRGPRARAACSKLCHLFGHAWAVTAEIDWQVVTYANAMHAFTLPDANAPEHGALFDATAERRSWTAMKTFLNEVFD